MVNEDAESVAQIIIGDFYLIRFEGKKTTHDFVGQVVDHDETLDLHQVKFLRKLGRSADTFMYKTGPTGKEDVCWVELPRQLLRKLPHPTIDKRNHVHFVVPIDAE